MKRFCANVSNAGLRSLMCPQRVASRKKSYSYKVNTPDMSLWFRKKRSFQEVKEDLRMTIDEARKRASILVIDDDEHAFPTDLLIAEGYKVTWWPELKSIRNLEEGQFDIIILDIYGICAPGISKNEGIGVLEQLKHANPAQVIIAYSGRKFDLKQEKFWRLADDF